MFKVQPVAGRRWRIILTSLLLPLIFTINLGMAFLASLNYCFDRSSANLCFLLTQCFLPAIPFAIGGKLLVFIPLTLLLSHAPKLLWMLFLNAAGLWISWGVIALLLKIGAFIAHHLGYNLSHAEMLPPLIILFDSCFTFVEAAIFVVILSRTRRPIPGVV